MSFQVVNYYDNLKKDKSAVDRSYKNEPLMNITLPARILICAPSGTGKTSLLMNIVDGIGIWDKIVLYAKDLEEPLYKHFIERCRKVEKKFKTSILLAISDHKDLPSLEDFNPKENSLLICDDLITETKQALDKLDPFWTRGRKKGVTSCFLSQGYFDVPKKIRKNSNYVILKKMNNSMDLSRIIREFALDIKPAEMQELYKYAMQGDPHTSFFMLDAETKDPAMMCRANFDPIPRS